MIKAEFTAVIKRNLPVRFSKTRPITIQFDHNSSKQTQKALGNFLYF